MGPIIGFLCRSWSPRAILVSIVPLMRNVSSMASRDFFESKMRRILREARSVLDIGGGLRALPGRGNRQDPNHAWLVPLLDEVDYKIMDPVPDYNPDVIGDIHAMPFVDDSQDAVICIAVLEHVEDPWKACREIHRVLKPGGYAYFYVPFLFYYHAEKGYYKDYWRFSQDAVELLLKDFETVEIEGVRGAIETWVHLGPLGRVPLCKAVARAGDRFFRKEAGNTRQVSGYVAFVTK